MNRRLLTTATAFGVVTFALGCTLTEVVTVVVGSVEVMPDSTTVLEGETQQLIAHVRDDSGREVPSSDLIWSSDAPSVFAVDPLTGEGQALGTGQATVWASQSGVRGSGIVFVAPGPRLVVGDTAILFQGRVGGPAPSPVTVDITNGGGGSLQAISASFAYPPGEPTGWLTAGISGTSAPATVTVTPLLQSLQEGVYHATLVVVSPDAPNSPVTVPVEAVLVLDTPIIGLSETSLSFQTEAGAASVPRSIQITNEGGGVLENLQVLSLYPGVGGWLSTTLAETTAPTELLVEADPAGLSPGAYLAEIRVTGPGALNSPRTLDVTLTIELGMASPASSTADVPPGVAGAATNIVVQARNGSGYPLDHGGASVGVAVSGTNVAGPIVATDLGNGTYVASYTPNGAGTDLVAITMDGTAVSGSPFTTVVAAGTASPANSTAAVPGGTAGQPTEIVVQARDEYGNPLGTGGSTVLVSVSGANVVGSVVATDAGNGTYVASYTPTAAGNDLVAIALNGSPIGGSPFRTVVAAGAASADHSTATVPVGIAGRPTSILVQARDAYDNAVNTGGSAVVVEVSGANAAGPIVATDVGDGTYAASYTPTLTGTDEVAVTMDGAPLAGSPFTSVVTAEGPSPEHSTAIVPNGTAGLPTSVVVEARDDQGNPVSFGGAAVTVTISGANNVGTLVVSDHGDGTYSASYTPTAAGVDVIDIAMDGTALGGSPFSSQVSPGGPSAAQSTAAVPPGTAGEPTTVLVQARDAYGNPLSSGGATVTVTISGANNVGALAVTDLGDGTYAATYTPTKAGTDMVVVTMGGTSLGASPFSSSVEPGAVSPEHSTAVIPPGRRFRVTEIVVQASDAFGNPITVGGQTVVLLVSGVNHAGPKVAVDVGDGTYVASYTPIFTGTDVITITMNGVGISGSPFVVKVRK